MSALVRRLCDHLLGTYGDLAFVTPAAFANALRFVLELPDDASPLLIEQRISRFITVRVNNAPASLAGWNYQVDGEHTIETGRNRSPQERNLTLVHEFGESLRSPLNAELDARGLATLDWPENYWDGLAIEILAPLARFRQAARKNGLDVIDLFDPLSFEAVVYRLKDAFEDTVPVFAVYSRPPTWPPQSTHRSWPVAAASWTKRWFDIGYHAGNEKLELPRRYDYIRAGSFMDDVRRRGRALFVRTSDDVGGVRVTVDVLVRPRRVGNHVAQVFAVGVGGRFGHVLAPQLQLVGPDEREGSFSQLF